MKEKPFHTLSGPWSGWSIQDGFRLSERLIFKISRSNSCCDGGRNFAAADFERHEAIEFAATQITIIATGTDVDGEFEMAGTFDPLTNEVLMIRRYTRAPKNPSQVGFPFTYEGRWNGYCIFGAWSSPSDPDTCGPFEMWPESQGEIEELSLDELLASGPLPAGV